MACIAVDNLGRQQAGDAGVFYQDAILNYVEEKGRWTNNK